jgi:hypothetical protein
MGYSGRRPIFHTGRAQARPLARIQETAMSRSVLIAVIIVLVAVVGVFAYQAYERDQNTLDISIGEKGIKVD